jgi:hypothetical protein
VIIDDLIAHEARIAQVRDILVPDINWRGYREMSSAL